jgi:chromosome segregation ATPase
LRRATKTICFCSVLFKTTTSQFSWQLFCFKTELLRNSCRNDEIKEEIEKRGKQVSLLEEREAHLKSNLSALQSKIQSLEAAAQLQSLHLESVILKESSLKRDLEALTEEKQDIAEKMRTCAEQLTLARSDAAAKETTIRQLSLKLQETDEVQKQAAHSAHVEHERATTLHQTLGSDNAMLQQKNFELTRALEASNKDLRYALTTAIIVSW